YILSEIEDKGRNAPFLIVAPASLVYNWKNEFHKFAPELNVAVSAGTKKERRAVLESEDTPDVYITSYHTLRQDIKWRSEEHTSELQSRFDLVCRLLLEKKTD